MSNLEVTKSRINRVNIEIKNDVYFRQGKVGAWKNHLTAEMLQCLDQIVQQKFKDSGFVTLKMKNGKPTIFRSELTISYREKGKKSHNPEVNRAAITTPTYSKANRATATMPTHHGANRATATTAALSPPMGKDTAAENLLDLFSRCPAVDVDSYRRVLDQQICIHSSSCSNYGEN
ncbi:hypothetical protein WN943_014132 [Citrus x changshan-huyou]